MPVHVKRPTAPPIVRGLALEGLTDKLVIQATAEEVAQIVLGQPVVATQAPPPPGGERGRALMHLYEDPHVYNGRGELVGIMRIMDKTSQGIDVSTMNGTGVEWVSGPTEIRIIVDGVIT